MLTITRDINVYAQGQKPIVKLSQYDDDFRLVFRLYTSNGTFTMPDGTTAQIQGTKTDGNGYSAAASVSGNTVTVAGHVQMTAAAGPNVFEIVTFYNNKRLSTINFILAVERAALDSDTVSSESVIKDLSNIPAAVEQAEAAADRAEEAARTLTIDPTLTQSGQAADAKVTGEEIADLKEDLTTNVYSLVIGDNKANPSNLVIGELTSSGGIGTNVNYSTTDFIEISANTDYIFTDWKIDNDTIATSRKYVALYDASKNFIEGSYQNVPNVTSVSFNSGSAKYCRLTSQTNTNKYLCVGTEQPTSYIPYEEEHINRLTFEKDSIPSNAVINNVYTVPINMYDSANDVIGVLMSSGNVNPNGTLYKTTDFIEVKAGMSYSIKPKLRWYCVYDAEKDFYLPHDTAETDYILTAPIDGYIRISYAIATPLSSVEMQAVENPTVKIAEGISLSNTQKKEIKEIPYIGYDILKGKKWAVCGDSFTNSGGTGTLMPVGTKYAGQAYTYPWIIGSRVDMEILQYFGGGRTLAYPAEPGSFVNSITCPTQTFYYQNIPLDADYITIYLGINDNHHATGGGDGEDPTGYIPLGTIEDTTTASYYGAWNVVLKWLIQNRPNAHIGIIVTNGIATDDNYRLAQIAIAKKYGIPYIDMNGDSRTPAMLRTSNPDISAEVKQILIEKWAANYPSNTHPNDDAQLYESYFIENFLRSI